MGRQEFAHFAFVIFARLPDDLHGSFSSTERANPVFHHFVERPGAERSPDHQHHLLVGREAVVPQRFGPVGPLLGEASAQRVAREPDFAGRENRSIPS